MSIYDFLKNCIERGLSEDDTVFEFLRRFPKNTIGRLGGQKQIRSLYQSEKSKPKL